MLSFNTLLITFRESLEAALVIGIILVYLKKIGQSNYNNMVYLGIGAGALISVILAYVFEQYLGGFEGRTEELFEGFVMLLAAVLITFMIFWMKRQKSVSQKIHGRIDRHVTNSHPFGIFLLSFISVGREGIETVIFLNAANFVSEANIFWSGILGFALAILLGYVLFTSAKKIPMKHFFNVTSTLLILFAAGLVAHGIHEFQEAGWISFGLSEIWNTNNWIDENGTVGSLLKAVFGYNGNPSSLEFLVYAAYLLSALVLFQSPRRILITR